MGDNFANLNNRNDYSRISDFSYTDRRLEKEKCEASMRFLCLALFNNPVFVTKACRYFVSQTTLAGFRCPLQKGRPFPIGNSYMANRSSAFSNLAPADISTETIDDAMRLITKNIIREVFSTENGDNSTSTTTTASHTQNKNTSTINVDNMPKALIQISTDLTLNQLITRVISTGDAKPIYGETIYYQNEKMILPEIAIFVIENLVPILDMRIIYHRKTSPTDNKLVSASWFHWLSHAYLGVPHTLFKGNSLITRSLICILPYVKTIFSQHAVHPHSTLGTPLYYEHCKFNSIVNEYFDGWYWVLTYLETVCRLVTLSSNRSDENNTYLQFISYRRWFIETLATIVFVVKKDIRYLYKNSIDIKEIVPDQLEGLNDDDNINNSNTPTGDKYFHIVHSHESFVHYLELQEWISFKYNEEDVILSNGHDKLPKNHVFKKDGNSKIQLYPEDHVLYKSWESGLAYKFWSLVIHNQIKISLRKYIELIVIKRWPV